MDYVARSDAILHASGYKRSDGQQPKSALLLVALTRLLAHLHSSQWATTSPAVSLGFSFSTPEQD